MIHELLLCMNAYLIGAIPTGAWIAYYAGVSDITKHGSGNIGATNVARILGYKFFFIVFFIDALKAFLYLKLLTYLGSDQIILILASIALLIGNGCSIFLKGKGGKGVATSVGILIALQPLLLNGAFLVWTVLFLFTKNVGVSSVIALVSLPFCAWYLSYYALVGFEGQVGHFFLLALFICVWGLWRHEKNIKQFLTVT